MLSRAGATWLHSWPHLRSRAGLGGPSYRGAQSLSQTLRPTPSGWRGATSQVCHTWVDIRMQACNCLHPVSDIIGTQLFFLFSASL